MSNTEDATEQDWEDFWYALEKFGTWHPEDFLQNSKENINFIDSGKF